MSEQAPRGLTINEFLLWQENQEGKFELVDGQPVAMAGARLRHDRVKVNVLSEIRRQFRTSGSDCDAFTDDIGIVTQGQRIRRPNVSVLCPPFDDEAMITDTPHLVVEVLSKSTERADRFIKLDEYKSLPSLDYILYISPFEVEIGFWFRDASGAWKSEVFTKRETIIDMPRLGLSIRVESLYERLQLPPKPRARLVWDGPATET